MSTYCTQELHYLGKPHRVCIVVFIDSLAHADDADTFSYVHLRHGLHREHGILFQDISSVYCLEIPDLRKLMLDKWFIGTNKCLIILDQIEGKMYTYSVIQLNSC